MSADSDVWRDGQAELVFVPPEGAGPVPEPFKDNPRSLIIEHGTVTLYCRDGWWTAGSVVLYGMWARKDGQPGRAKGHLMWSAPLSVEEGAPQWLVTRMSKLLKKLTAAMRAAER